MDKWYFRLGKVLLLFASSFLFHFLYQWFPCPFTLFFAPVNESIWEHMKLISSAILLVGILEYAFSIFRRITISNFFLSLCLSSYFGISFYLLCYLLFPSLYHSMPYIFLLLLLTVIGIERFSSWIRTWKPVRYTDQIGMIGLCLLLITFGYLTYHPLHNALFFDTEQEKYGLYEYVLT